MSTDLDTTTFNTPNGYVTTDFDAIPTATSESVGKAIALQSNGQIVMAGNYYDPLLLQYTVAVCRYNSNGTLDLSFGGSGTGKVTVPILTNLPHVYGITLQSTGEIVICGTLFTSVLNIFVMRLTSAGILDTLNFNAPNGYVITTPAQFTTAYGLTFDNCEARTVTMQTYGGIEYIVIGGDARGLPLNVYYYAVARYTLSGSLDTTFGSTLSGLVVQTFNLPSPSDQVGFAIYADSTKILLAGSKIFGASSRMTVVKFDGIGILESTWGNQLITNGLTDISNFFTQSQDQANAIVLQSDGKIVLGGSSINVNPPSQRCFALARLLLPTGFIDTTYGTNGKVLTDLSPSYNLDGYTMGIQPDDKIILGGLWDNFSTTPASFALARYLTTGSLDTTFGLAGTGLILEDIDPNVGYVETGYSLAIQPDGKVLMGGELNNSNSESGPKSFILARYFGFPPYPPPIVPICFPAGTPVLTDQGNIPIELIDPNVHTIKKKTIVAITQSFMNEDTIVCIEKHSLGINIPNKRTYISNYHGIIYKNNLIPAKQLVGRLRGIYHVKYNNQILYNVLMEKHYIMNVNNMSVETLNPKNIVAKLYTNQHSPEEKMKLILEINEITKNNKNKNKNNCENYNGYEKITQNFTRRKFSILRYNPLINRLNFYTKKHFVSQNNPYNNTIKNHVSFKKYNPNVKINTHKFRYGRRIR